MSRKHSLICVQFHTVFYSVVSVFICNMTSNIIIKLLLAFFRTMLLLCNVVMTSLPLLCLSIIVEKINLFKVYSFVVSKACSFTNAF